MKAGGRETTTVYVPPWVLELGGGRFVTTFRPKVIKAAGSYQNPEAEVWVERTKN